jgi:hypothetical protein
MTTMTDSPTVLSTATALYRDAIMRATLGQVESASIWYREAEEVAEDIAEAMNTSLEVGACIIAAFSPRERWSSNIAKATSFALGNKPKGLSNNLRMAENALTQGFDALKGLKTNAFARAIAGDTHAVVIDVWMMRAAQMNSDSPNVTQYRALTAAVNNVAREFDIMPRTAQALIWIIVRGGAA